MKKPKIIVILGQTSTGKSDFAVDMAHELARLGTPAEIISADSRQVYKGLDLGTGKITAKEMRKIPHHLLDVVSPKKVFSASDFKKHADKKIREIIKRGAVPILCGGTGFYIDAVVDGMVLPEVPPNPELRKQLATKSAEELFAQLQKTDPERADTIDRNNKVRLIRALEIVDAHGSVPKVTTDSPYDTLKIGLTLPDELLKERIRERLLKRIKKGMLKEIKDLHEEGLSWKRMNYLGLEYRYGSMHLQKLISKEAMIDTLVTETWHYAKRQKTWFKRDTHTVWIDPREVVDQARALRKIKDFLS